MPDLAFRDPDDSIITVKGKDGALLFQADVMELNSIMAAAQREAGGITTGALWLVKLGEGLQRAYNLANAPSVYNCDQLVRLVHSTILSLKNEGRSTPTSSTSTALTQTPSTPSSDSNSNSTSLESSPSENCGSDTSKPS